MDKCDLKILEKMYDACLFMALKNIIPHKNWMLNDKDIFGEELDVKLIFWNR